MKLQQKQILAHTATKGKEQGRAQQQKYYNCSSQRVVSKAAKLLFTPQKQPDGYVTNQLGSPAIMTAYRRSLLLHSHRLNTDVIRKGGAFITSFSSLTFRRALPAFLSLHSTPALGPINRKFSLSGQREKCYFKLRYSLGVFLIYDHYVHICQSMILQASFQVHEDSDLVLI